MGYFSNEKCAICGERCGTFNSIYLESDEVFICYNCQEKAGVSESYSVKNLESLSLKEIKNRIEKIADDHEKQEKENSLRNSKFKTTYQINDIIWFDDDNKMFVVPCLNEPYNSCVFMYDEIFEYEVIENDETQFKGGFGKAIIGNALLGLPGAIAGGTSKRTESWCSKFQIRITTTNPMVDIININLIDESIKYESSQYRSVSNIAQKIIYKLKMITSETKNNEFSIADEIKKFKELLDMGAITQEEYDNKKNELLNMK